MNLVATVAALFLVLAVSLPWSRSGAPTLSDERISAPTVEQLGFDCGSHGVLVLSAAFVSPPGPNEITFIVTARSEIAGIGGCRRFTMA
jgi:hypothetical protein